MEPQDGRVGTKEIIMKVDAFDVNSDSTKRFSKIQLKVSLILLSVLVIGCHGLVDANNATTQSGNPIWGERADSAQAALDKYFWNYNGAIFYSNSSGQTNLEYWWQAHAMDVLVDGYLRTGDSTYAKKISTLLVGVTARNGGFFDDYYDDEEWMALALFRAYNATGNINYYNDVQLLWSNIQTAWDSTFGGGLFQRKSKHIYKDVPANAPACILACELYEKTGDSNDLAWANKIFAWLNATLVDSATGIINDGLKIQGTIGTVQTGQYPYNYGTYLYAALQLFHITNNASYLDMAVRTANVADSIFVTTTGILRDGGAGDGGLFKGIYVQYLVQLALDPDLSPSLKTQYESFLEQNAESLWHNAQNPGICLFNGNWEVPPTGSVSLSQQLSGMMLLEAEALINEPQK